MHMYNSIIKIGACELFGADYFLSSRGRGGYFGFLVKNNIYTRTNFEKNKMIVQCTETNYILDVPTLDIKRSAPYAHYSCISLE